MVDSSIMHGDKKVLDDKYTENLTPEQFIKLVKQEIS